MFYNIICASATTPTELKKKADFICDEADAQEGWLALYSVGRNILFGLFLALFAGLSDVAVINACVDAIATQTQT